jgi:hypothetical protein
MSEVIETTTAWRLASRDDFIVEGKIVWGLPYILKSTYKEGMWSGVKRLVKDDVDSGDFKQWLEVGIVYIPCSSMDVITYTGNLQMKK